MSVMMEDDLEVGTSEFEEAYEDEPRRVETFSAEMLEETLERIAHAEPQCVQEDARVADVIRGMAERNQGCVLVTRDGQLTGIFTDRDVLRRVYGQTDPSTPIAEVMTRDPEAVSFHDTVAVALNKMTVGGFRHVPLVDIQGRPTGVVSVKDIVNFFVEHFPAYVLNVPPDPTRREPDRVGGAG